MDCYNSKIESSDYLIIGGGVAGLAAANRLIDKGGNPVIVDAGGYPCHKICGEFFSYECHEILQQWDMLPSIEINTVRFHVGNESFPFSLPVPARSISRYSFDEALCKRAVEKGAARLIKASVVRISYDPHARYRYTITFDSGKTLAARTLFIGTGRLVNLLFRKKPPKIRYLGFKAHFEGVELKNTLEMFVIPNGYLGMSPIENNHINVACIADIKAVRRLDSIERYIENVLGSSLGSSVTNMLYPGKRVFNDWMVTEVPEFKFNSFPYHTYKGLYLIGDAAASIAPASGDGLAMAVTSGAMAADYAIKGEDSDYQKSWAKQFRRRLGWAKVIHKAMFHPIISKQILRTCSRYPDLFHFLFKRTRG